VRSTPEGGAQGGDLGWQAVPRDDPALPHAGHQRLSADHGSTRFDQRHQHVKGTPAELDWPTVGEHLAAAWQHLESTERDACRWFGARSR
jgi:hypothetical protein